LAAPHETLIEPTQPGSLPHWRDGVIEVTPLGDGARVGDFLRVADVVYADDPAWIPPLRLERRLHLSRQNPFNQHGRWQGWVAWRDGRPVGRISAQVDALHHERYGPDTGHFGFLDAIDDARVFEGLTAAAEAWLAQQGARCITGPFSLSINQECGVLIDGFEHPPAFMMPHARPWFAPRLEALGYNPAQDLLAYTIKTDFEHPEPLQALARRFEDRIHVRPLERGDFKAELERLRAIFNDGWADNWGFVPFTQAEFAELGQLLRAVLDDDAIQIAEVDGEPAAFIVALPDINEAIRDLGGSLLPFGWARMLTRLYARRLKRARVPLLGVRQAYQNTPLGTALAWRIIAASQEPLRRRGIEDLELSWILEGNRGIRKLGERTGARAYKRYRLYEKIIPPCLS